MIRGLSIVCLMTWVGLVIGRIVGISCLRRCLRLGLGLSLSVIFGSSGWSRRRCRRLILALVWLIRLWLLAFVDDWLSVGGADFGLCGAVGRCVVCGVAGYCVVWGVVWGSCDSGLD